MWVSSGRASPNVLGLGRRRGAAAGPVPPAGMCLVTPGWRGDTRTGQGDSKRSGFEEPRTRGTLLCHPSRGPAFARCFPRGCGSCLATDLWMFAHSCLLMCLGTKSCGMQHCGPAARSALPGWKSASTPAGRARTHTHTHPSSCLAAPQHPDSTGKLRKLPELPGQMAGTSPGRAQGNRAPCGSGAMPPLAARLARCPPARCQAKFLAISRLTPAARDAPASSCCLPPAPHTGREHPHVPMLHGPICNPCLFGTYPHGDPIRPFSEITCLPPHAVPACSSTHG